MVTISGWLHCCKSLSELLFCTPKCSECIVYKYAPIQLRKSFTLLTPGPTPEAVRSALLTIGYEDYVILSYYLMLHRARSWRETPSAVMLWIWFLDSIHLSQSLLPRTPCQKVENTRKRLNISSVILQNNWQIFNSHVKQKKKYISTHKPRSKTFLACPQEYGQSSFAYNVKHMACVCVCMKK